MISITFYGYKGTLTVFESGEDTPIYVWVGDEESRPAYIPSIDSTNGKHKVYGMWESYCQNDSYKQTLTELEIYQVEIE